MLIMPGNNTGITVGWLAGRYPGKIGHLYSPRRPGKSDAGPYPFIPFALDNGVYAQGEDWNAKNFFALLDRVKLRGLRPQWVIVPDMVGDRAGTLDRWQQYADQVASYGWPLAFAVQDGMLPSDVPDRAEVVFVGGTTTWKWRTMTQWTAVFRRVHVGRVNTYRRLWQCHDAGAESCDGTGWTRGWKGDFRGLLRYLQEAAGERERPHQMELVA